MKCTINNFMERSQNRATHLVWFEQLELTYIIVWFSYVS